MAQTTEYRFEGGPLDGTARTKTAPARPPAYLTTDGETLYTPKGDRLVTAVTLGKENGLSVRSCYSWADDRQAGDTRTITYRFITLEGNDPR